MKKISDILRKQVLYPLIAFARHFILGWLLFQSFLFIGNYRGYCLNASLFDTHGASMTLWDESLSEPVPLSSDPSG